MLRACNLQELDVSTFQTTLRLASFASNSTFAIGRLPFFAPKAFGVVHGLLHDRTSHLSSVFLGKLGCCNTDNGCDGERTNAADESSLTQRVTPTDRGLDRRWPTHSQSQDQTTSSWPTNHLTLHQLVSSRLGACPVASKAKKPG